MVRRYLFLILLFWVQAILADVAASLRWDSPLISGQIIQSSLIISHSLSEVIDKDSFVLDDAPLQVKLIEKRTVSPEKQESVYSFSLPEKAAGLYVLPSIQFRVNGQLFQTDKVAYEVDSSSSSPIPSPEGQRKPMGATLLLEAFLEQDGPLYPGQTVDAGYRYIYNDTIELTKETLPLLQPEGFTTVGSPKARSFLRGNVMVREVRQTLKAEVSGQYAIGPSVVEGYVYRTSGGQKKYIGNKLTASAPAISVEIDSFPEEGRPASFYGAIGSDLSIRADVRGFTDVSLGEALSLTILIAGTGDIQNAPLPQLCCQPGFVGRFEEADVPVVETFKEGKKYMIVDLKPLSTSIKAIPPIEYSFFDPSTKTYKTLKTDPIPITVTAKNGQQEIAPSSKTQNATDDFWSRSSSPTSTAQEEKSLEKEGSGLFKLVFMLLVAGIMALGAYVSIFRKRSKKAQKNSPLPSQEKSVVLLEKALQSASESVLIASLQDTFLARLQELKEIPSSDTAFETIPNTGNSLRVKEFFTSLEKERFSGKKALNLEKVKKDAISLFDSLS